MPLTGEKEKSSCPTPVDFPDKRNLRETQLASDGIIVSKAPESLGQFLP